MTKDKLADMKIAVLQAVGAKADEKTVTRLALHLTREDAISLLLEDLVTRRLGMRVVDVNSPETKIVMEEVRP